MRCETPRKSRPQGHRREDQGAVQGGSLSRSECSLCRGFKDQSEGMTSMFRLLLHCLHGFPPSLVLGDERQVTENRQRE